ncbi:hypothetical protein MKW98_022914 [Papaver atlanticum]|uniref:Neprosin PEP catalytic domain-containing protein n=1 Tax=Papaver atlanticum TaxID=357466 RepID=A0AAD4XZU6_9MAGN|nr:hypothetical protein MKW98_022914 [Papaver atlanticum]
MATSIDMTKKSLIFTILVLGVLFHELVQGRKISETTNNKAIIKTIKGHIDEIIDCYDIHKQPAFDDDLFHNHTIQMRLSSYPKGMGSNLGKIKVAHIWHKYGTCPEGSVPIRRSFGKIYHPKPTTDLPKYHELSEQSDDADSNEFAVIRLVGDNFQGAQATINVWKPPTNPGEFSASLIVIASNDYREVIQAGWEINKSLYGDDDPRFFLYWTADGYQSTGCYNNLCPGFVQTSTTVTLGSSFKNTISVFKGVQYEASFSLVRDQSNGNWWVLVQGAEVGYLPPSLFKELSEKATRIEYGGQVLNKRTDGGHTTTQMGSGHFPSEGGFGVSSFFRHVLVVDGSFKAKDPDVVLEFKTNPNCYDLKIDHGSAYGYSFYYGGPGFSATCQ